MCVTSQVFEFLIRLHSSEGPQEEEVYPYVRTLLHFDTREFLNVLALVSHAQEVPQETPQGQVASSSHRPAGTPIIQANQSAVSNQISLPTKNPGLCGKATVLIPEWT